MDSSRATLAAGQAKPLARSRSPSRRRSKPETRVLSRHVQHRRAGTPRGCDSTTPTIPGPGSGGGRAVPDGGRRSRRSTRGSNPAQRRPNGPISVRLLPGEDQQRPARDRPMRSWRTTNPWICAPRSRSRPPRPNQLSRATLTPEQIPWPTAVAASRRPSKGPRAPSKRHVCRSPGTIGAWRAPVLDFRGLEPLI